MLLLSDASLIVFLKFLQIFLWISIPAFLIGLLITTVIHYNDKRKKQKMSLLPSNLYLEGDKQETKKIMNYFFHSNARYIAIQKDFKMLTEKYQQLKENINKNSDIKNIETMETIQTDMQQLSYQQIDSICRQHEIEKKELLAELDQLTKSFENLERDNNSLRDQL